MKARPNPRLFQQLPGFFYAYNQHTARGDIAPRQRDRRGPRGHIRCPLHAVDEQHTHDSQTNGSIKQDP